MVQKKKQKSPRKPGKQPGVKGFGRSQPLKAEVIIPHYPHLCSACNHDLKDWTNTELSIGTIDRCIRETGIACVPVVEELVEQLQQADILHWDETHWYESGKLHWLWVAVSTKTAVFHIGSRRKEELSHLIRKAVAVTGAQKAATIGQWILDDLRELIAAIADLGENEIPKVGKLLARLTRVGHLGKKVEHTFASSFSQRDS